MSQTTLDLVSREAERASLELSPHQKEALVHYLALLLHWNQRLNLTSRSDPAYVIQHHLADVFFLGAYLHRFLSTDPTFVRPLLTMKTPPFASPSEVPSESKRSVPSLLDVGSGAGIPGLILAILFPMLHVTLVESNSRKCSFLRTACFELHLSLSILQTRLEEATLDLHDIACSRATWSPLRWLDAALPLVRPGGLIVSFLVHDDPLLPLPVPLRTLDRLQYVLSDGSPRCLAFFQPATPSGS
jgi:16S rRNA G527 N7-methylase RsmG